MRRRRSRIPRVILFLMGKRQNQTQNGRCETVSILSVSTRQSPTSYYVQTIPTASHLSPVDSTLHRSLQLTSNKPSGKHLPGCPTCEAEALRPRYRVGVVPTGIEACDWPRDVFDLCWLMHLRRPKRVYQPVTFRTIYLLRL